jgi:hypothetical protein
MALYRIQASLQDITLLAKDRYVNTYYVDDGASTTFVPADAAAAVAGFYMGITSYISPQVYTATGTVAVYRMSDPRPRAPIWTQPLVLNVTGAQAPLPAEVALCMTMHADPVPLPVKPMSWRGRVYIGPLNQSAMNAPSATGADRGSRPGAPFIHDLLAAGLTMANALEATGGRLCIASFKQHMAYPVANLSVDDAWDTQRSRGDRPGARSLALIPSGGGAGSPLTPAEYATGSAG